MELGRIDAHRGALQHLYGADTVASAEAMLQREQRFFGLKTPGMGLEGCDLHRSLLAAYNKVRH
jgi:ribosomal protein S12 methylthiotransferase accessory factor